MIRTFQEFLNKASKEEYQKVYESLEGKYQLNHKMSKEGLALSQEEFDTMTVFDIIALRNDIKRMLPKIEEVEHNMNYFYPAENGTFKDDSRFIIYRFDNFIFVFEAVRLKCESWQEVDIFAQSVKRIYCERWTFMQSYEDLVEISNEDPEMRIKMREMVKRMTYQDRLNFINDLEERCSESSFEKPFTLGMEKWFQIGNDVVTVRSCSMKKSNEDIARHMYSVQKHDNTNFDEV